MEIPQLNKLHRTQLTRKCFSKRYPEYYHYLLNKYPDVDWKEGWYLELNHLSEPPRCPMCGSPRTLISIYKGYSKNCSRECSYKNPERIQKIESTTHDKYGVKHPLQSDELKLKAKITSTKRYGDPNYNNRDKCKNTCIEKYGEWAMHPRN